MPITTTASIPQEVDVEHMAGHQFQVLREKWFPKPFRVCRESAQLLGGQNFTR